jgi:predicted nucleic acid-binding protein
LAPQTPLWLSAVVLHELYAGAGSKERRLLARMEHQFVAIRRVLVPTRGDWTRAGMALARLAAKYGYERIGRARLSNDALIAMGAARLDLTLLTANQRDFARLAEFQPFRWQVFPATA